MNQEKLSENQVKELKKYIDVYNRGTTSTPKVYGHNNWGAGIYSYIEKLQLDSILDMGCGQGVFVNDMVSKFNINNVYGADIASISTGKHIKNDSVTWIDCMAHDIPLKDNSVEYIVSFDCLEHCLTEDVENIVNEFDRVCSKGLILKIAYRQAQERSFNGEVLHMTVKPESWWIEQFSKRFDFKENHNGYLVFNRRTNG